MAGETSPQNAPAPRSLQPGLRVLGRYELIRELGRGGMGVVWLARDERLDRQVAIKVLPEVLRQDRAALLDLRDETRRTLEITHSHIVRIYDFEEDSALAGITMEYVDGQTLAHRKSDRPQRVFEPLELVPWIRQLCEALHYAHTDPRVVHRDLKPANLMVNGRGQLKITDFGIARSITDSISRVSNAEPSSGTLVYMSPQQLMGSASASDDIYSIGATLYDLITGKPPFHTGNVSAQILQATAPPMAERRAQLGRQAGAIPPVMEEVIAACLAKQPGDRPRTALAIVERIEDGLTSSSRRVAVSEEMPSGLAPALAPPTNSPAAPATTAASASPPLIPPLPSARPQRWLGVLATLLLLGILGLGVGVYLGSRDGPKTSASPTPAPKPAPAPMPGRIVVNTIPSGADVHLDGRKMGASPITLDGVPEGDHRLRFEANGYHALEMNLVVRPGETIDRGLIALVAVPRPPPEPAVVQQQPPVQPQPQPAPSPQRPGLSDDAVRGVILRYLTATAQGDNEAVVSCYASGVDFFGEGNLSPRALRKSLDNYRRQWPDFDVTGLSDIAVKSTNDPEIKTAIYTYRFVARNGGKYSSGFAHDRITVKLFGARPLIIRAVQDITERKKNF